MSPIAWTCNSRLSSSMRSTTYGLAPPTTTSLILPAYLGRLPPRRILHVRSSLDYDSASKAPFRHRPFLGDAVSRHRPEMDGAHFQSARPIQNSERIARKCRSIVLSFFR